MKNPLRGGVADLSAEALAKEEGRGGLSTPHSCLGIQKITHRFCGRPKSCSRSPVANEHERNVSNPRENDLISLSIRYSLFDIPKAFEPAARHAAAFRQPLTCVAILPHTQELALLGQPHQPAQHRQIATHSACQPTPWRRLESLPYLVGQASRIREPVHGAGRHTLPGIPGKRVLQFRGGVFCI